MKKKYFFFPKKKSNLKPEQMNKEQIEKHIRESLVMISTLNQNMILNIEKVDFVIIQKNNLIIYSEKGWNFDPFFDNDEDARIKLFKVIHDYMDSKPSLTIQLKIGLCKISTKNLIFFEILNNEIKFHFTDHQNISIPLENGERKEVFKQFQSRK